MPQITNGARAVLSSPFIYNLFQNIMGANKGRVWLANEVIRPESGDKILDVGCGTAEILAFLPGNINYFGYDISENYIAAAKKRYGHKGTFLCCIFDEAELSQLPLCDVVLALGFLHHLDDEMAVSFLKLAKQALRPEGRIVTVDPCFSQDQNSLARFLISHDRGENVRDSIGYGQLIDQVGFKHVKGVLRHQTWIPYTHWIMECTV